MSSKISRFHVAVVSRCLFFTLNSGGDARINYLKIDVKKEEEKKACNILSPLFAVSSRNAWF